MNTRARLENLLVRMDRDRKAKAAPAAERKPENFFYLINADVEAVRVALGCYINSQESHAEKRLRGEE